MQSKVRGGSGLRSFGCRRPVARHLVRYHPGERAQRSQKAKEGTKPAEAKAPKEAKRWPEKKGPESMKAYDKP